MEGSNASFADSDSSRASTPDVTPTGAAARWTWTTTFSVPWDKMPAGIKQAISTKKRPTTRNRREMIRIICDDILERDRAIGRKSLTTVAQMVVSEHPDSFRDVDPQSSNVIGSGYDSVLYQIENRIYNLRRHSSLPSASSTSGQSSDADESVSSQRKRAQKDNYGCINWEPSLPDGETLKTQEDKKELLKRNYGSGNDSTITNEGTVRQTMQETYHSQRRIINQKNPPLDISHILEEWPYLRVTRYLLDHFEELTGSSADTFDESLTGRNKGHRLYQFVQTYRCKKKDVAKWCDLIDAAVVEQKSVYPQASGLLPLLLAYFSEKENMLLKIYDGAHLRRTATYSSRGGSSVPRR